MRVSISLLSCNVDLGGIGLAWRVYKQSAVISQLMPGKISNDELFWLSAGQVWCSVSTPAQAKWQIANDVHSPGKYRIIGPMSNLEGFADTFKCPSTSFMGRSKTPAKCTIW
jgi:membrane metallo-endopeptidase-like protein 1